MERVSLLHSDLKEEIIIKWNYKDILKRCKLLPQICNSYKFWLKKAAWDLGLNFDNLRLSEYFELPELDKNLKPTDFTPYQRYIRTLLYYGHVSVDSKQFINNFYLAKIAMFADDIESFREFVSVVKLFNISEIKDLGNLALYLEKYEFLAILSGKIYIPSWMMVFLHLAENGGDDYLKSVTKTLRQSDIDVMFHQYSVIMGKSEPTDNDLNYSGKMIVKYTAKFRGFKAAEEIPRLNEFIPTNEVYITLAITAIELGNMDIFRKYLMLADWNTYFEVDDLAFSQNVIAFVDILNRMRNSYKVEYINNIMSILQSDNKIYSYIVKNITDINYVGENFSVLQDLESYTYKVSHMETLSKPSIPLGLTWRESSQIILREQLKRKLT